MGRSVRALEVPQKQFLQRFLASHVITEKEAQALWDEIAKTTDARETLGRDLNHTLGVINRSISNGFGLEVRTATLALDFGGNTRNESDAAKRPKYTRFHAIVNRDDDDIAKKNANPAVTKGIGMHEMALFRLILERLIESHRNEEEESNNIRSLRGMGCQASMSRMDMLNLRTELSGHHANKLDIGQTERSLSLFESEGWLAPAIRPDSESEALKNDQLPKTKKRRNRNAYDEANFLQIGPRTYMELPQMLTSLGLDRDLLPQFILHGN